ncbi:MAG TPA: 8-oxo-dGTP diphosphatase [Patescibacteria group bacterium]|nr:8-oxo-dGTP diphosphatase [Patescibacteria group bacterium]
MKDVTLLFLLQDDRILLAMKKRGFGVGKWNGVGGKADPGETVLEAAVRECQEEIGVTPLEPQLVGDIEFRMSHDPAFGHHAYIFTATAWEGDPRETEEMRPEWFVVKDIPYGTMWADDILWLPYLLKGQPFHGKITLGPNDEIISKELEPVT